MPEELRARIAAAAAGNPLFISEMLAMTRQTASEVEVPASLKALLAARLDQLDPAERRVLECGSVEGEVFHRGAVQALTPEETQVTPRLAALVRRELIRSDRPQFAGEDGFRFRHLLIRDTAYDALPKAARAELHQRFAAWLEQHGEPWSSWTRSSATTSSRPPATSRSSDSPIPRSRSAPGIASLAAGQRALDREDERAAAGLLERALELTRPFSLDVHAELDLAAGSCRSPSEPHASPTRRPSVHARPATRPPRLSPARWRFTTASWSSPGRRTSSRRSSSTRAAGWKWRRSRGTGLRLVGTRLRRGEHARPLRRLGCGIPAGAPPQPARRSHGLDPDISGSRWLSDRVRQTRRSKPSIASSQRARPRGCGSAAPGCSAMLDRGDEARRIADDAATRLREQSGALWGEWSSPSWRPWRETTRMRASVYASSANGSKRWSRACSSSLLGRPRPLTVLARSLR